MIKKFNELNSQYNWILYFDNKKLSGWEELSDAIDVIIDRYTSQYFMETIEYYLSQNNIDLYDEPEDIDIDDLNESLKEALKEITDEYNKWKIKKV